jgi:hypothetical protein
MEAKVEAVEENGTAHPCLMEDGVRCRYGSETWQHFGPELMDLAGTRRPILYIHPIRGSILRASFPVPPEAKRAVFRFGLSDGSADSPNRVPVEVRVLRGRVLLREAEATNVHGLQSADLTLTSTDAPLILELRSKVDGSRVFGFDLELYRE